MLHDVIDRAIQIHGALGYSADLPLEEMYRTARNFRISDGADEVHIEQVAKMILSQALALGVIGLIPGAAAGIVLAYLINLATYPLTGNAVPFHLHGGLILGALAAAPAIAVLASLLLARRAARLRVIEALQYE